MQLNRPKRCNVIAVRPRRACRKAGLQLATPQHAHVFAAHQARAVYPYPPPPVCAQMRRRFCPCPPAAGIILTRLPVSEDAHGLVEAFGAWRWIVVRQPAPHELSYGVRTDGRVLAVRAVPAAVYLDAESSGIFALPGKTLKIKQKICFTSLSPGGRGMRGGRYVSVLAGCTTFAARTRVLPDRPRGLP